MLPDEVTEAAILPWIPRAADIDQEKDKGLQSFAKILQELWKKWEDEARFMQHLAQCYLALGRCSEAKGLLQRLMTRSQQMRSTVRPAIVFMM